MINFPNRVLSKGNATPPALFECQGQSGRSGETTGNLLQPSRIVGET